MTSPQAGTKRSAVPGQARRRALICITIVFMWCSPAFAQRLAQLSWWDRSNEEKVGHYWIKTDLPANEASALAQHLNVMYSEYSKRMANLPVRVQEKLNVLIFKNRHDYTLTLRARFGVTAGASGGMFFATSSGTALAFWIEDLPQQRIEHVIQHEGFHQFAYSRFGNDLPIWLNEGLAEMFGEAVLVGQTLVFGQSTPRVVNEVKGAIEAETYIPFRHMLNVSAAQWNDMLKDDSAPLAYSQAWSMVHFLIYGEGGRYADSFDQYLKHLNTGLPSEQAFVRSFGEDVEAFERQWKAHAAAATPGAFITALERLEFLAEGLLELSRHKVHPQSLEALQQALRQVDFTFTQRHHALEVKLTAADDELFRIPKDDLCLEQPEFVVSKTRLMQLSRREALLEQANPTPATIATEHLRPLSAQVHWVRDAQNNTFRYQIVVK